MARFKIFTNDRGCSPRGKPLYSALTTVDAANAAEAVASIDPSFGPPHFGPIVAIEWPVTSKESDAWLKVHT